MFFKEDWDEEGWDGNGYYDDQGNWVEEAAKEEAKEEEQPSQPAASSSSQPGLAPIMEDAFPALGGKTFEHTKSILMKKLYHFYFQTFFCILTFNSSNSRCW